MTRSPAEDRAAELVTRARVDADRQVTQATDRLRRICAELVRRDVATDLVPSWITRDIEPVATVRADWPDDLAATARLRELEELLRVSQRREADAIDRLRDAEDARDTWHDLARKALAGREPIIAESMVVDTARRQRNEADRRLRLEKDDALAARNRATILADFIATLPKLPVPPAKLHPDHLMALAAALDPSRRKSALPPEVVSELHTEAVRYWRRIQEMHRAQVGGRS